jgi:PTS system nitrogen regulatory IIA component
MDNRMKRSLALGPSGTPVGAAMEINDFLSPADVLVGVRAADKVRLLQDLSRRAAESLKIDGDVVAREVLKREELGSTGTGGGIAIPHARIGEVKRPFGVLARLRKAIPFDAIDGKPVDVVFLLLLPTAADGEQLNALASVARKLRNPKLVENLRRADGDAEAYRTFVTKGA